MIRRLRRSRRLFGAPGNHVSSCCLGLGLAISIVALILVTLFVSIAALVWLATAGAL